MKMLLTRFAVKLAARLPNLESYQRYLFVGPHPDDIEIGAGATAAKLCETGKDVCFLICTDGRYGTENLKEQLTPEQIAALRKNEAISAAASLGVKDVRFLGFSDGGLYQFQELGRQILNVIADYQPDVVFAPDPCVTSECHVDHLNVGNAVRQSMCLLPFDEIASAYGVKSARIQALAYYMTANVNCIVRTSPLLFQRQQSAIFDHHLSQYPSDCGAGKLLSLYLRLRAVNCGLRKASLYGEGFRVLGAIHMHCLPEAGA